MHGVYTFHLDAHGYRQTAKSFVTYKIANKIQAVKMVSEGSTMSTMYVKQKVFSIGEKFTVTDIAGNPRYYMRGSFLAIPKSFVITSVDGIEVARIEKEVFSLLPRFTVTMEGLTQATISKRFTFLRDRYDIDVPGLQITGDWWDLSFEASMDGAKVAYIRQKLLSWGDSYEVRVLDDRLDVLILALVIAIDRVKADEAAANTSA